MGLNADLRTAAQLVADHPALFGGMLLKDDGRGEEVIADYLGDRPPRKLPAHVDLERLDGGLDVAATLAAGRPVLRPGLLQESAGALLLVPGAERLTSPIAGRVAAAMDDGKAAVLLLDRSEEGSDAVPACLTERVAFHFLVSADPDGLPPEAGDLFGDDEAAAQVAAAAVMLGVTGSRADLFALRAARAEAASRGVHGVDAAALSFAIRTVLAPRATRLPAIEPQPAPEPEREQEPRPSNVGKLEDVVLEAVRTALPGELIAALLTAGAAKVSRDQGKAGQQKSPQHGRTIGTRAGRPGSGARLAILATLRAAAPWQRLRGRTDRILLSGEDLRIRRHQSRAAALTVFAVDASGSAAAQRLAEAKGAVETLLQQSYVKRAEVALVAIRGDGATLLLPPTRSLTRARRLLAELPGGGGTPLAAGIDAARDIALAAIPRGRVPSLVLLTDGRANIALNGSQDRVAAIADVSAAAKRVRASALSALVIDIGPRARPEASSLARDMAARYLHLPLAQGGAVAAAISGS